jgi:hypothetical protein
MEDTFDDDLGISLVGVDADTAEDDASVSVTLTRGPEGREGRGGTVYG